MENGSPEQAYQQMRKMLNEKPWRQYLAVEARLGGSPSAVAQEAGVSLNTVKRGLHELEVGASYQLGERIRKVGGGKKKLLERDPTLLADLEQELEPKGDPMSLVQWTSKSLAHLVHNPVVSRPKPMATVIFTYDNEDRITSIIYSGIPTPSVSYTYDGDGNVLTEIRWHRHDHLHLRRPESHPDQNRTRWHRGDQCL